MEDTLSELCHVTGRIEHRAGGHKYKEYNRVWFRWLPKYDIYRHVLAVHSARR